MSRTQRASFNRTVKAISANKMSVAINTWKAFVASLATGSNPIDMNALIQQALRESYLETNQDLLLHASKVKYYNELKKAARGALSELRDMRAQLGNIDNNSSSEIRKELGKMIEDLEEDLSSVGDDAQLANIDLQNKLQKQQQTLQVISNVSKMLHDTAMAVIRKIG